MISRLSKTVVRLIKSNATDENWDYFGAKCPYYGVVTWDQNKPENFDEKARSEFFRSGGQYVDWIMKFIRENIKPDFHPAKSIDFGSGVGRLLIPIAQESGSAIGVEISPSMIEEANHNCRLMEVSNVRFVKTVDERSESEEVDFINSFIVFQHIPPERGYEIFKKLLNLLKKGGIGAVHFTYNDPGRRRDRYLNKLYRKIPICYALRNIMVGQSFLQPRMEMAEYSINRLFKILQESGCNLVHTVLTRHGVLGAVIIFQKGHQMPFGF